MDFKGKVVLITGASSGIGADAAVYLSSLGAELSLTGRNEKNLKKTVGECKDARKGSEPFYIIGDVNNEDDVRNILTKTIEKYGRLDVLINNAGFSIPSSLETIVLADFDAVINTNVRSVILFTQLAMPYLIKSKGNVVNISSMVSLRQRVGLLSYTMSKGAMDQFTKCVALEVASKQVRVNSVNPGVVETNFLITAGIATEQNNSEKIDMYRNINPIGRVGTVRDISYAIAFLASDLAANITGTIFVSDSGLSIKSYA